VDNFPHRGGGGRWTPGCMQTLQYPHKVRQIQPLPLPLDPVRPPARGAKGKLAAIAWDGGLSRLKLLDWLCHDQTNPPLLFCRQFKPTVTHMRML
jgi:hypothetical protein